MAMNLNAVLRVATEVTGLQGLSKLEKGIQGAEKAARSAKDGFKAMLDSNAFRAAATAAAGLAVAIGVSAKAAIEFEESMADVRKVLDVDASGFREIRQEIIKMSETSPLLAKDFADIFAAAGRAGIAREELKGFADGVANISVAFGLTAEEAGTAFAKIRTVLSQNNEEMMELADAINHLGNNVAVTEGQLVDFMKRTAAVGQAAGLSGEQTAAFGAAMVAGGAEAEVAATSFRRMVSALSAGENATERQIGVLGQLGYVIGLTADEERILTQTIEEEARRRIDAARQETNERLKTIDRYYRDRMTKEQDAADDELEAVMKKLRKREELELAAARRKGATVAYLEEIRDRYDKEEKIQRRAARDRMTARRDEFDDLREAERNDAEARFKEQERFEEERKKMLIEKAKETAKAAGVEASKQLAANLQADAIGTITDLFDRLRQLPKEAQLASVTAFFGEEARALVPLITNADLLEKTLGLVADKNNYLGGTLQEAAVRLDTTATKVKIAQGQINNLAIAFGENFAPAITKLLNALAPVIRLFTWLIDNVPLLGPALALVTSAFVALAAAAPFITSFISLMGALGISVAKLAGLATVVQVAFSGLVSFLVGTILPAILAIFTGPAGWITLAIVAVGAMVVAFREPLGQFVNWLGGWFQKIIQGFTNRFIAPLQRAWGRFTGYLGDAMKSVGQFLVGLWQNILNGVKAAVRGVMQHIANQINFIAGLVNKLISAFNRLPGPDIPLIPRLTIPAFAEGGVVKGPTLAMVGERETEYIIPQSKMAEASARYLMGNRGSAVIPAFANGGVVDRGANVGNTPINITTGPVLQQNGQRYVTMNDLESALSTLAGSLLGNNRSAGGRRFQGV